MLRAVKRDSGSQLGFATIISKNSFIRLRLQVDFNLSRGNF